MMKLIFSSRQELEACPAVIRAIPAAGAVPPSVAESGAFGGAQEEVFCLSREEGGTLHHEIFLGVEAHCGFGAALYAFSKAFRECRRLRCSAAAVDLGENPSLAHLSAAVTAACLVSYCFDKYKSEAAQPVYTALHVFCPARDGLRAEVLEAFTAAQAQCAARDMINEPPTVLTPEVFADRIEELLSGTAVRTTVYGLEDIKRLGLTAFLEVGKGSVNEPRLVIMEYKGAPDSNSCLALVGKGLTYDSGGYSLQSTECMETMQHDMSGGASVAAALGAIAAQGLPINVTGVIAACENKLSATAYVPGDVIHSLSGKTIEVNNTDAEGRITLADAVTYAKTACKATHIIDIATLTDAVQTALGDRRAGLFSNDPMLAQTIYQTGQAVEELVWEMPCDARIGTIIESRTADMKNSAMGSPIGGYATVGAMFIKNFAEDTPWAHIDIGGVAWTRESEYYYTKGAVGFGTRLLYYTVKKLCGRI